VRSGVHENGGTPRNPDGSHYNDPGIRYISYFNQQSFWNTFFAI